LQSRPVSHDVDYRSVTLGTSVDSVINSFVTNAGNGRLKVKEIRIITADSREFAIVSGIAPFDVLPGESRYVEFRFRPQVLGERIATVEIITQDDTLRQKLYGNSITADVSSKIEIRRPILQITPNPVSSMSTFDMEITGSGMTKLYLCDVTGRTVCNVFEQYLEPGEYRILYDLSILPSGIYICVLSTKEGKKVEVVRIK
jgi:hypothetical protein